MDVLITQTSIKAETHPHHHYILDRSLSPVLGSVVHTFPKSANMSSAYFVLLYVSPGIVGMTSNAC